jgi:hypothetical protein
VHYHVQQFFERNYIPQGRVTEWKDTKEIYSTYEEALVSADQLTKDLIKIKARFRIIGCDCGEGDLNVGT